MLLCCLLPLFTLAQNDTAMLLQAKKMYNNAHIDSAVSLLNAIIKNKNTPYQLQADAHNLLGDIYSDKGNLPEALSHFLQTEKIGTAHSDTEITTQAAIHISGVYREQNNLPMARQYIDKAAPFIQSISNRKIAGNFYNNKAILLEMTNQFDSAIDAYNKALEIYIAANDSNHIAIGYNNLGVVYKNKGAYNQALLHYQKVVELEKILGNQYILGATYINIGSVNIKLKKYNEAITYNRLGFTIAKDIGAQYLMVAAADNMAQAFYQLKMPDSAYAWQTIRFAENEKYLNAENSRQINEMQAKYETEKKEQTIALQQTKLSRQKLLITGGSVLVILLLLSAYLLYRRNTLKKEKQMQQQLLAQREAATINILTAEENERKRIAAELHDGVGQLMTAAWLNLEVLDKQLQHTGGELHQLLHKASTLVGECCKEVRQVSHNMMPNALLKKGLVNAIKEFTQQIDNSVISINLQAEGLNTEINSLTETILYRVVQECVNNTIKHAAATELDISIHNSDKGIDLLIEDNGKGFDTIAISKPGTGLGLQNIQSRIAFLKGTVHWDSSPGNGTVVAIHIPPSNDTGRKN
jgi:two-component system, NarL family, sensor kinase